MKKTMIIILIMFVSLVSAQKKKKTNILQSTDIQEIELFLQTAHPEDPRRSVLKPKLIALKNAAWTKGAKDHKPMEARPILTIDMPENMGNSIDETEEFNKLISLSSEEH
ncbi:MAG: hypothetical protein Q4G16_06325, partial [Cruoricaptor ignavus]|nr:hypothetical protein [Cruoricaptor ignavus]